MHAVAVDDEKLGLDYIEQLLERVPEIDRIERFQTAEGALEFIRNHPVDLLFLDIEMPGMNGLAMADTLSELNPKPEIVFVTAHREHALDAFDTGAMDYLVKPIRFERLIKTIERYKRLNKEVPEAIKKKGNDIQIRIQNTISVKDAEGTEHELEWRTSKAKELFLYLLHFKNRTVSKSDIVETIWSGKDVEKAFAQLYTVVYHTRKALNCCQDAVKLISNKEGYKLEVTNASIDIDEWTERLSKAETLLRRGDTETVEQALTDYHGDYLAYSSLLWPEQERLKQQLFWQETCLQLAKHYEDSGRFERALYWLEAILHKRPLDERIHLRLMKLYASEHRTDLVHTQYEKLESLLREELGTDPDDAVKQWYADFLQHI
ncbi:response regulator [Salisediminibacterium selenitireducens]|uniref:Response regulator receiver and SARP domain protein n=1 Tax=Bacillus selenitireducens (strain ATCC 700615 / DSM 15326 / MLS10) TaxID=439292 RepID=D6XY67_BACIE|nr:response regulator [Salisediminibacterium selenitireducens]ADH98140.1 response regulator receiver and SARP domain protein [[Bacillus] selenitireducens MLS10]